MQKYIINWIKMNAEKSYTQGEHTVLYIINMSLSQISTTVQVLLKKVIKQIFDKATWKLQEAWWVTHDWYAYTFAYLNTAQTVSESRQIYNGMPICRHTYTYCLYIYCARFTYLYMPTSKIRAHTVISPCDLTEVQYMHYQHKVCIDSQWRYLHAT